MAVMGETLCNSLWVTVRQLSSACSNRLKQLEHAGIIVRKAQSGRRSHDYFLTPAGKRRRAVAINLNDLRWQRHCRGLFELPVAA